jgi:hypothetical protein
VIGVTFEKNCTLPKPIIGAVVWAHTGAGAHHGHIEHTSAIAISHRFIVRASQPGPVRTGPSVPLQNPLKQGYNATTMYRSLVHLACKSPSRGWTLLLMLASLLAGSGISTAVLILITHDRMFAFAWGGIIGLVTCYCATKNDVMRRLENKRRFGMPLH